MQEQERQYLPLRQVDWRIVIGLLAVNTICLSVYKQLDYVANGVRYPAPLSLLEEIVGALAGLAVFPLIYFLAVRFSLQSQVHWRKNLLIHLASLCGISLIHTSLIVVFRHLLFPLFGYSGVSYGYMPARYSMEFAHLFIYYWVIIGCIYLFHEVRFARQRELSQAGLERSLAEARLQNLRLQLEPHFLFNALNAISAAIYEDPRIADEMVGRLSDLLRQLLKNERSQQVPLGRELELLKLYVRVMEARFEHRLNVTIEVAEELAAARVPQLIVQPLVENAIRHGMDPLTFKAEIEVAARREGDALTLTVRDRGPGFDESRPLASGIGLSNTRERLAALYGKEQSVTIENALGGGVVVALRFPYSATAQQPADSASVQA